MRWALLCPSQWARREPGNINRRTLTNERTVYSHVTCINTFWYACENETSQREHATLERFKVPVSEQSTDLEVWERPELPCCTSRLQSGSWASCSRISSTSRFLPGGSTSRVICCCRVWGRAISWVNWPSGLLSTYQKTSTQLTNTSENVHHYYSKNTSTVEVACCLCQSCCYRKLNPTIWLIRIQILTALWYKRTFKALKWSIQF